MIFFKESEYWKYNDDFDGIDKHTTSTSKPINELNKNNQYEKYANQYKNTPKPPKYESSPQITERYDEYDFQPVNFENGPHYTHGAFSGFFTKIVLAAAQFQ